MIIVWITVASLIGSLIYSLITIDYTYSGAMWAECFFPGVVAWNKLSEANINLAGRIIATTIVSVVLFTYPIVIALFCIGFIVGYGLWELFKIIFKKR